MRFAKRSNSLRYRLGELLLQAGIISPDVLSHSLSIAKRAAMPIGRVLVMSGHVSELDIDCAVETQDSIRDGTIDERMAKELLRFSHVHQVTINEAYTLNGISRNLGPLSRLGKLVLAAGVVDESGLECAIRHSSNTAYPLGRALVSLNLVSEEVHIACMNLQILVRDERISFLDAVKVLQKVHAERQELNSALETVGYKESPVRRHPRLGELLVESELLSYEDSLILTELGTENDITYGQLLIDYELVSPIVIEAAVQIQRMFSNYMFTMRRAVTLIKLVNSMKSPLEKILSELDVLDQVVALLRAAELLDEKEVRAAAASIRDFEYSVGEALVAKGVITQQQSKAGLECLTRIQAGNLTYDQAVDSLRAYKIVKPITIDEHGYFTVGACPALTPGAAA